MLNSTLYFNSETRTDFSSVSRMLGVPLGKLSEATAALLLLYFKHYCYNGIGVKRQAHRDIGHTLTLIVYVYQSEANRDNVNTRGYVYTILGNTLILVIVEGRSSNNASYVQ